MNDSYISFMREAIALAERGRFATCPNPVVGALLVKDGKICARGWHKKFGGPHAEIECLEEARARGIDPRGAEMVVTLEPCRHHGKTPPCANTLLEAGIARLVYGAADPNPEASGGAAYLAERGLEVIGPVLEAECRDLIADFIIWQTTRRPYIYLKLASTLDGRIATRTGHSQWISNEKSRQRAHALRAGIGMAGGAVLIGGGTFRADNPALTARIDGADSQPIACILTSRLPKADAEFKLLNERPDETVFFASPAATASTTAEALRKLGSRVIAIGPGRQGGPDFDTMFRALREEMNCHYVLCEGGGRLALSLLEAGFTDEFHLYLAPIILGDNDARPLFNGRAPLNLEDALGMRLCNAEAYYGDALLTLRPRKGQTCSRA